MFWQLPCRAGGTHNLVTLGRHAKNEPALLHHGLLTCCAVAASAGASEWQVWAALP